MPAKKGARTRAAEGQATPVEDVDAFLEEVQGLESRKSAMIQQLLATRSEMVADIDRKLAMLGYTSSASGTPARASSGTKRTKRTKPSKSTSDKICPICSKAHGRDIYGHDGRSHRNHKAAFTDEELAEMTSST